MANAKGTTHAGDAQRWAGVGQEVPSVLSSSIRFTTTPPDTNFKVGDEVAGYEILDFLGFGGMGLVLKVRNVITDRIEAMKVILPSQEDNPDLVARFRREVRIQSTLYHPNVAAMHTAVRYGEHILMFMEYVEGVTMQQRLKSRPIAMADCVEYSLQLLDALSYAHERGIIHRDIKPSNVMITASNTIKLMDFGAARPTVGSNLTRTGIVIGSLSYLSPEQRTGSSAVDSRTDLFAAGLLLYETLNGQLPIPKLDQTLSGQIESDPHVPMELRAIIMKAISDDPGDRFQSADAFRVELAAFKHSWPRGSSAARSGVGSAPGTAVNASNVDEEALRRQTPIGTLNRNPRRKLHLFHRIALAVAVVFVVALVARGGMGQRKGKDVDAKTPASQPSPARRLDSTSVGTSSVHVGPLVSVGPAQTPGTELKFGVSTKTQHTSRKLTVPEVRLDKPAPHFSTFDPPALNALPVPDAFPSIGLNVGQIMNPSTPVILHARHVHNKVRSAEGLVTVYGHEYRFQESGASAHAFAGLTADLLSSCRPQKTSCTVQVMDSGHKEVIKLTPTSQLWNEYRKPVER